MALLEFQQHNYVSMGLGAKSTVCLFGPLISATHVRGLNINPAVQSWGTGSEINRKESKSTRLDSDGMGWCVYAKQTGAYKNPPKLDGELCKQPF